MPGSRLLLTRSEHFVPVHLDMCQLVPLREGFLENGRNQPAKAGSIIFSRTAEYHGRAFTRFLYTQTCALGFSAFVILACS